MHIRIGYISTALLPSKYRIEDRFDLRNGHLNIPQPCPRLTQVHKLMEPIRIIGPNAGTEARTEARPRQRRLFNTGLKRRRLLTPLLRIRGMCIRPVILLYGWIGA